MPYAKPLTETERLGSSYAKPLTWFAMLVAIFLLIACYLIGGIPFGYLMAKSRGVDLFSVGSGNIGATNVGRVLGRKFGIAAFLLDFLKGALPVAFILPIAERLDPTAPTALGYPDALRVLGGLLAFLGHLYPVYLKFRGGKGVATGAGVAALLMPGPFAIASFVWICAAVSTRYVSFASIAAALAMVLARLFGVAEPFAGSNAILTAFALSAGFIVVVKHRANVGRLRSGTESRIADGPRRQFLLRALHLLALGLWCGAGAFFIFLAATPIFESFHKVVEESPNYRTANLTIVPEGATELQKKQLGSALAGAAVGPLFPRYFQLSGLCAIAAVFTSLAFKREEATAKLPNWRLGVVLAAATLTLIGGPLAEFVAKLNAERFDSEVSNRLFQPLHGMSLMGSAITTLLVGVALVLAARLPITSKPSPGPSPAPAP